MDDLPRNLTEAIDSFIDPDDCNIEEAIERLLLLRADIDERLEALRADLERAE